MENSVMLNAVCNEPVSLKVLEEPFYRKGFSPFVNKQTGTWWEYDDDKKGFFDTGIIAQGRDGNDYVITEKDYDTIVERTLSNVNPTLDEKLSSKLPKSPTEWGIWTPDEQAAARERIGIPGDLEQDLTMLRAHLGEYENLLFESKRVTDIFEPTLNVGFMSLNGSIYTGEIYDTFRYTNKIPVKSGDILSYYSYSGNVPVLTNARYFIAFSGDNALQDKGIESTNTYTVPDGIDSVVITIKHDTSKKEVHFEHSELVAKYISADDTLKEEIEEKISKLSENVVCYLPKELHLVGNKEYEIYNNCVLNYDKYDIVWSRNVTNYGNKIRFSIGNGESKTITMSVMSKDNIGKTLLTKTIVVYGHAIPTTLINLLPFGDSLTNHCKWEAELMNMANINTVGSRSRQVVDSSGNSRVVYDEGRAGFATYHYCVGTPYGEDASDQGGIETPHNRWYDPNTNKFSMSYYMNNYFPSGQNTPNCMTFFLGMNDCVGQLEMEDIKARFSEMLSDIRNYSATMPIVVIAPQFRWARTTSYIEMKKFIELTEYLEEVSNTMTNVAFVPLCVGFDCENNYPMTNISLNPRNSGTEKIATDNTHPSDFGYWQIADLVLGAISNLIS